MKMLLLMAALLLPVGTYAQVPTLRSVDLQADETILRSAYEQLHPGLYRYNTKAQMDANFEMLHTQLGHDQSLQDAYVAFSEFAAKVRCGHTQTNPVNQSKATAAALFQSQTRVPFYFEWLNGHMIVTRDFTPDHALPVGTDVVRLNGVAATTVLKKLLAIARADGGNDSKRVAQLAVNGDGNYEAFDLYYPMYFPHGGTTDTLVVQRPKHRSTETVTVTALTFEQRIAPIKERESQRNNGGDAVLFEWKYLADGSAYLKMPTWALFNSKWDWKSWVHQHLDEAAERNAPALILDVRGNEGGLDVGNEIVPHLIDAPVTLTSLRRLVRYRRVPDDLVPYLDTWDKSFRDWKTAAVELPQPWPTTPAGVSYLKLTRYDDSEAGDVIKPAGKRFRGKVIVLTDATNSSATFGFAQTVQTLKLGTLVGQTTGGSQRGINGGAFFFLRLPHSGIELDLPLIGYFPAAPMPDKGISPEVPVTRTAEDIATGFDRELDAATKLVAKR